MHLLLRIFLAVYLAIWSPALCCCGVKAAMGRITGVDSGTCHQAPSTTPASDDSAMAAPRSCCAHKSDGRASAPHHVERGGDAEQSAPCRCHQSIESKVRLDTGSKVALPGLIKADVVPIDLPMIATTIVEGEAHLRCAWPPREAWSCFHVARGTLVAQRCLLLI